MKLSRIALFCLLGGLPLTISAVGAGHFLLWWLSGIVLAAAFVPLALYGPRNLLAQFGAISLLLFVVSSICIEWEAAIFLPGQSGVVVRNIGRAFVLYLIFALGLVLLSKLLKLPSSSAVTPQLRSIPVVTIMVVLSGVAYVIYYFVFGGLTYTFFTKQYYPQAQAMAVGLGISLLRTESARGILMTLAALPAIGTLRMPRWAAAISVGFLLWIAGGGAQLLVPNPFMVPAQRYIHIVEILTQNVLLGITAVLLLRKKSASVNPAPDQQFQREAQPAM